MRYWFLKLHIQCGEYEFYSKSVQRSRGKSEFDAEEYAKDFYGDEGEETYGKGTYYFNCGEIAVSVYGLHEITAKEYKVMEKYL
jgi:hypothetical protein